MAAMASPWKSATDSPSRQLLYELSRLGISTQEKFYARLDRDSHEREAVHKKALALAAAEHDRVRRSAEIVREILELQIQTEQRQRDDEERKALDKKRQEKADREIAEKRREIELAKLAALEEQRATETREAEVAAAEEKRVDQERKHADAARAIKEKQDAIRKAREAAIERTKRDRESELRVRDAALAVQRPIAAVSTPQTDPNSKKEVEHQRYMEIHHRLKELRNFMVAQAQQNPPLKQLVGDMRREIKKSVGQLIEGKGANTAPLGRIKAVLKQAASFSGPSIDVTMFLAIPPSHIKDTDGPALLLYLLNIFAKAVISQFIDEAGVSPKSADPVGTVASHIFALEAHRWNHISLIDILIAKLHVVCPVLWGAYGDETTNEGKRRLGWWREEQDGPWVSEQRHHERMTGLGAGFASISLRNYEKATSENPYPHIHYWKSLANFINMPPENLTPTHFVVLKAMLENNEARFLEFFGDVALVVLRHAIIELPNKALQQGAAVKALAGLAQVLSRDKKITL